MVFFTISLMLLSIATLTRNAHVEPIVLVHGGADNVNSLRANERKTGVKKAAMTGYRILKKGGSVVDAVEGAVKVMEDDISFNAGTGSALTNEGEVETDAAIMLGSNLSSGAVSVLKNVAHPVNVARLVMEKSPHCLLVGEGAKRFAKDKGVPFVHSSSLISTYAKQDLEEFLKLSHGQRIELTAGYAGVGAIAMDSNGHVAAASSSGGTVGKYAGRSSAASIVGAGLYADDEIGAVVVTGLSYTHVIRNLTRHRFI